MSKDYPDFIEETGYGTVDGLGGANCRHTFFPYFPGISSSAYNEETLKEFEGEPIVFDEKEYTPYEATQRQRSLERAMRHTQRQIIVFENAGLEDKATSMKVKLRGQQDLYIDFSKTAGIITKFNRVGVYRRG